MAKQFSFKGDGASQETVVFGNTFPVDKFVTPEGLNADQVKILLGHPMFDSQEGPEAAPVASDDAGAEQSLPGDPAAGNDTASGKGGK